MKEVRRCAWAEGDPLLRSYHDDEWGVVERDPRALWEALALEGFQAGLAWITILRKRETFRAAFAGFEPSVVARFGPKDVTRLMADPGIVRARAKVVAAIGNAQGYLAMKDAGEDFSAFAWAFTGGKPIRNESGIVPAKTELSERISGALKERGFKFVGPVGVYAWMQAVGIVNDHAQDCFRRNATKGARRP
jgi:DNA-3-methyladenine glycosylase I